MAKTIVYKPRPFYSNDDFSLSSDALLWIHEIHEFKTIQGRAEPCFKILAYRKDPLETNKFLKSFYKTGKNYGVVPQNSLQIVLKEFIE